MSWVRCASAEGEAVWEGEDALFDPCHSNRQVEWHAAVYVYAAWVSVVASAIAGVAIVPLLLLGMPLQVLQYAVYLLFGCAALVVFCRSGRAFSAIFPMVERFYHRRWRLTGGGGLLRLDAKSFDALDTIDVTGWNRSSWTVAADDIERVEVGLTKDWVAARRYRGAPLRQRGFELVPSHEYQTYLHLSDGSRRVIMTANADRQGCATLAQSVRAWLEGERRKAVRQGALAHGEGFSL